MKSRVTRILSIGIALVAVAAVQAQTTTMTANVPFSFNMGNNTMPQGAYKVEQLARGGVLCMRSKDATKAVTTNQIQSQKASEPERLVFHRYGDSYFLAEIWTGNTIGRAVTITPREKELVQNGAAPALASIRLALHR